MLKRQTSGSIVCPSCNQLISVQVKVCPHCNRQNPSLWGYGKALRSLGTDLGFLSLVTWGCLLIYLATLLTDIPGITTQIPWDILAPSNFSLFLFGSTGAIPVFGLGRWWTIFTAAWLHGDLFHIGFNLAWIHYLAPVVAQMYGASRLVIIYLLSAASGALFTSFAGAYLSFLPSIFQGAGYAVGASGALFGLFGALISYGQITGDRAVQEKFRTWAIIGLLLGLFAPNIDNWGHLGGFVGGLAITRLPWFSPRKGESHWQILVAIACLLITVLSLIASLIQGIWLIN